MMKIAALLVLVTATCAWLTGPNLPENTQGYVPPAAYREIWKEAEACSGFTGDFDRVQWYIVPGHDFKCPSGRCIGEWSPPHAISIADEWKNIAWVVKHEMVHELTGYSHDDGPRDKQVWGIQCQATWGYLPKDTLYIP
jgi:hypothetical protein